MRNENQDSDEPPPPIPVKGIKLQVAVPNNGNRVGLPMAKDTSLRRHLTSFAVTHSLRKLRLSDDNEKNYSVAAEVENVEPRSSNYPPSCSLPRVNSTPTPVMLLPEDVNKIITDVDLQEEANRRLQEEEDEELACMLQKQEEELVTDEVDRDRRFAIEAQDEELAKLLHMKEKAKVRRAKERARQRALLKKQHSQSTSISEQSFGESSGVQVHSSPLPTDNLLSSQHFAEDRFKTNDHVQSEDDDYSHREERLWNGSTSTDQSIVNVATHIDSTYLSKQSATNSIPNSLIFTKGETRAPSETTALPYMPMQGQRGISPLMEQKPKKLKSKDGCKQQ